MTRVKEVRRHPFTPARIAVLLVLSGIFGSVMGLRANHQAQIERALRSASASASIKTAPPVPRGTLEVGESIYDGKLAPGWEDWGWGPHELGKGPARISFAGYGGFVLHHGELPPRFAGLAFRVKAPKSFGDFLVVSFKRSKDGDAVFPRIPLEARHLTDIGEGWQQARLEWKELNPKNSPIDRVVFEARVNVGTEWVLLDKIALTKLDAASSAALTAPVKDARVGIRCDETARPISSLIYGVSHGAWDTGAPAWRIGGNPITRLNWDLGNAWNTGSDWFFQNAKGDGDVYGWVDDAAKRGVKTALTVPIIGWVAKDTTSVGFPASKFDKQRKYDPNRPESGDGHRPDGTPIPPGPPTQTSVPAPPELVGRWVRRMRERDTARGTRGVDMYILDNEPTLWDSTHRDVHPEPLTYDELLDRTIRYATEVRKADPEALIAGPAEWGWTGYFYSAKDRNVGAFLRPDRRAHGDVPLVEWYLASLAAHEKATGTRLLDVLDLHFYPAAEGVYGDNGRTDPEGVALRLRSTRALWDPTYADESWIKERVRLIPRMKEWVKDNYPGLKTSLGEWSFGADGHISGALATAEALGRFGQHGLDAAYYWAGPKTNTKAFWAFRAFRNFDGTGGRFLDWSVPVQETENVSVFASRDETGTHLVVVLLNLDPVFAQKTRIVAESCGTPKSLRVFSYDAHSTQLAESKKADVPSETVEVLKPYSLTVVDLHVEKATR